MNFLLRRTLSSTVLLLAAAILTACQTMQATLTPEQIAVLKREGFVQHDTDWELNLSGKFLFETDQDDLGSDSIAALQKLARALLDVGIERVRVDGHTDSIGDKAYNMTLSERRARNVAEVLISSGMQRDLVQIRALGDTQPLTSGKTRAERRENRRVVVVVSSLAPK